MRVVGLEKRGGFDSLGMISSHHASGGLSPRHTEAVTAHWEIFFFRRPVRLGELLYDASRPAGSWRRGHPLRAEWPWIGRSSFPFVQSPWLPAERWSLKGQSFKHWSTASRTESKRGGGRMRVSVVRARFVRPRLAGRFPEPHEKLLPPSPSSSSCVCAVFCAMSGRWSWMHSPPVAMLRDSS